MRKLISPLALLVAWELASRLALVDPLIIPPPSSVFGRLWTLLATGALLGHVAASLKRVALGYSLAMLTAVPLGISMAWWHWVNDLIDPLVELIRPVSPIAILPLAILWFGIGDESKVFIIALACAFPIILNTYAGVRGVDRTFVQAARSLGATDWESLTRVALPAALPSIWTGLRLALGIGLIVMIASEMVAARGGLGYLIINAQQTFKVEEVFAGIVVIGLLGFTIDALVRRLRVRLMPWYREVS